MAQFSTLTELIAGVMTTLRRYPGSGAQLYSEDVVAKKLKEVFFLVSEERWYSFQMKWFNAIVADGTTGLPTTDFTNVRRFSDIRAVFISNQTSALPKLPPSINPYQYLNSGATFVEELNTIDEPSPTSNRLFRLWPLTTTSAMNVHARVLPTNVFDDPRVRVPFDNIVLENGAAMKMSVGDGANPAMMAELQGTYADRLDQIQKQEHNLPLLLDPRYPQGVTNWTEQ